MLDHGPFSLGLFWLRARRRKRDAWFYLALAVEFLPPLGALYVMAFIPEFRFHGLAAAAGMVVSAWLLRDYLPWAPRSRTERVVDQDLGNPPLPAREGEVPAPPNTLLDHLDAASRQGRWALVDGHASGQLRWSVDPDPSLGDLRRATRQATKAAKRRMGSEDRLKVSADLRRVPGPDVVSVGLVLRGPGIGKAQLRAVEETFDGAFRAALGGKHRVERR